MAVVQDGDETAIDLDNRKFGLLVALEEKERRTDRYELPARRVTRGYLEFYADPLVPAPEGAAMAL